MKNSSDNNNSGIPLFAPAVLPDGRGGFTPCPDVLTGDEAVRYLRLDVDGPKNPLQTLRYYREKGKLKGTRMGKKVVYTREALNKFLQMMTGYHN
jgi:hypothetical protein